METKKNYQKPFIMILKGEAEVFCQERGYEICALCHCLTDVPKTEMIGRRNHYIEGVGQLCPDCAHKLCDK